MAPEILRVLLVDDDSGLRTTMSDIFKLKGFDPILAETGQAALAQIEQQRIDVALIDLKLEDMPGLDVLRGIKANSPDTECILLTGHASQGSAIEAINAGAYSYFQKPCDIDQLVLSIRRAAEKRTSRQRVQRLLDHQLTINQLALAVGESLNLDEVYHTIHKHILELMDVEFFVISSYDEQAEMIHAEYASSDQAYDVSEFPPIPLGEPGRGTQSRVIHTGQPLYTPNHQQAVENSKVRYTIEEDGSVHEESPSEMDREDTTRSAVYLPMKIKSKVVGIMQVQSHHLDAYSQEEINLLAAIANVAAVAIQNARLHEDALHELAERVQAERALLISNDQLRRSKDELSGYRDHLEELIKERTAELEIARDRAESANRSKSAFLSNMSHEIRTPLNGVIGLAQLALQTDLNNTQQNYLAKILSSGETLLAIINDILDFSKVEAGKLTLESVEFDLEELLRNSSSFVVHRAHEKGLELVFDTRPNVPRKLVGDPLRLGQVLSNLLSNAVKFTQVGEIVVDTELVSEQKNQVVLKFSVRDTGIGLSDAQITDLFQPFTQADSSISRRYGGTGLGMAISQEFVNLMGGQISAKSQLDVGSTFSFNLTFGKQPGTQNDTLVSKPEFNGNRVLVVDDNAASRKALQAILESFFFQVKTSESAEIGLACLEQQLTEDPFNLILMDHQMPGGMDGMEALRKIWQRPQLAHIPAILLVNANDSIDQETYPNMSGILPKPIFGERLLHTIMEIFTPPLKAQSPATRYKNPARSPAILSGKHVLLVEDNEINQIVATDMLLNLGLQVAIAHSGLEAIQLVGAGNYDVVLMDIQMPEMDGYQATAQIRLDPRFTYARLPIIAVTASALVGDREKALEAGMNDHIAKPVDIKQLTKVLINWIKPHTGLLQSSADQPLASVIDQVTTALPVMPGIDTADGMSRLDGKQDAYLRLLAKFRDNQSDLLPKIHKAMTLGDQAQVRFLIHTIKGLAGHIGAKDLGAAAKQVEIAMDAGDTVLLAERIEEFEQAFNIVMLSAAELEEWNRPIHKIAEAEPVGNHSTLAAQLSRLAVLLAESDAEAADLMTTILEQALSIAQRDELRVIEKAIMQYDFEQALKHLRTLTQDWNISTDLSHVT